ncbi:MAG: hypothetical protein EBQ66_09970 [Flavobacteriia bacterium]|nr:hypothetical protein [Flavobacteriia bacterium]
MNGGRINESKGKNFPTLEEVGFEMIDSQEEGMPYEEEEEGMPHMMSPKRGMTNMMMDSDDEMGMMDSEEGSDFEGKTDTELSQQIDKLIEEAKKRKVSESSDLHFLKFLNKSQVNSYYSLTNEDQEQVKLYINEKSYFTSSDVLKMIGEALSVKNESLEERLTRLMPENIKPIWSKLNESSKKSILSQARLYPDLTTESKVEHFWLTRPFKKNESVTKKLVNHNALIQEDKLSDSEVTSIMERLKNL